MTGSSELSIPVGRRAKQLRLIQSYYYPRESETGERKAAADGGKKNPPLPLAYLASGPICRCAAESEGNTYGLLFRTSDVTACRGVFVCQMEKGKDTLTITGTPATIVEEYLPLMKWWFHCRLRWGSKLRRRGGSGAAKTTLELTARPANYSRANSNEPLSSEGAQQLAQLETYNCLAIYNSISLLSSLNKDTDSELNYPLSLKLLEFRNIHSLLIEAIGTKAHRCLTKLNLSACTGLCSGSHDIISANITSLLRLEELLAPLSDMDEDVLSIFLSATLGAADGSGHGTSLRVLNLGECRNIKSSLHAHGGTNASFPFSCLTKLHLYCVPEMTNILFLRDGEATSSLEEVNLSHCEQLKSVSGLEATASSGHLRTLDCQKCTELSNLNALIPEKREKAQGAVVRVERLLLTGCAKLRHFFDGVDADVEEVVFETLRELYAGHSGIVSVFAGDASHKSASFPRLEVLSLPYCPKLGEGTASASWIRSILAGSRVTLRTLDLSKSPAAVKYLFTYIRESVAQKTHAIVFPALESLVLAGSSSLTDDDIILGEGDEGVISVFPHLKQVSFSGCHALTEKGLSFFLRRYLAGGGGSREGSTAKWKPSLEVLNLNYCQKVSSFSFLSFHSSKKADAEGTNLQNLKVLFLSETKVGNNALENYISTLPFLQYLQIINTNVNSLGTFLKKFNYVGSGSSIAGGVVTNIHSMGDAPMSVGVGGKQSLLWPYLHTVECNKGKNYKSMDQLEKKIMSNLSTGNTMRVILQPKAPEVVPPVGFQ